MVVLVVERLFADQHFEEDTAEGPEVDHAVVAILLQLFRSEVGFGPTDAVGLHYADWSERGYFSRARSRTTSRSRSRQPERFLASSLYG